MPQLINPKREAYCQHRMRGMSQVEAHAKAGYSASRTNATQLEKHPEIQARMAELRQERKDWMVAVKAEEERDFQAEADREEGSGTVSARWLLLQLRENLKLARETGNIGAANKALETIGKLSGHLRDGASAPKSARPKTDALQGDTAHPFTRPTPQGQIIDQLLDEVDDGDRGSPDAGATDRPEDAESEDFDFDSAEVGDDESSEHSDGAEGGDGE